MSDLKPYLVEIYGITHCVLLSDEDADARGLSGQTQVTGKVAPIQPPVAARRGRKPRDKNDSAKADD